VAEPNEQEATRDGNEAFETLTDEQIVTRYITPSTARSSVGNDDDYGDDDDSSDS
jgi:hypothetical protein